MAWDGHSKNNGFPVGRPLLLSPKPHDKIAEIGDSNRSQIAMKSVIGERRRQLFETSQDERNWESDLTAHPIKIGAKKWEPTDQTSTVVD
ncbi:hypothetical protein B9Z55_017965 [Caenorhabditis nigoni]|uniref:Uncharacterized protein n=1 Tax=Caenorhabditis nigoni TaxID=1611254 RepID=A0A2G5TBY9_9PELO|nr:hypothetical protein B9Z55_017965 [Caenorhabditis nigoni]